MNPRPDGAAVQGHVEGWAAPPGVTACRVGRIAPQALSAVTPGFTADNRERLFALRGHVEGWAAPPGGTACRVGRIAPQALSAVTPDFTADNRERLFALRGRVEGWQRLRA
ncbi:hypothetical protein Y880_0188002 [Pseudomonas aeruginosa PAK]|nr:hypothetical protein Y880_0188002 [Pseudomonas aeruginosa PAK]